MPDTYVYRLDSGLYINLTNRCCNACEFCLRGNGDGIGGYNLRLKKEPTAEGIISRMYGEYDFDEVVFCGFGEPTYKLEIIKEVADAAHKLGKPTRLNTNGLGSLVNNRDITTELKGHIDIVSISLNSSDGDAYNKLVHSQFGNAYSAMLEFTSKCIKHGIKTVMSVVDVIGKEEIEKCRAIAEGLGAEFRVRKMIIDN